MLFLVHLLPFPEPAMPRTIVSIPVLLLAVGALSAFDVQATIKKIDADKGMIFFSAEQKDRAAKVEGGAKILGADGKPLDGGLKAKELREGAVVTLSIENVDGKPIIKAITLTKQAAKIDVGEFKKPDTSGLVPLTDMDGKEYKGFKGGLYPDGTNTRPKEHEAAGLALAKQIQPLDADGKPSKDGKIVLLGIGFSNTVQGFGGFMQVAKNDKDINPHIVLVNGAMGGMSANMVQNPDDKGRGTKYWTHVDDQLKTAGVTRAQVEVIWIKETNPSASDFPKTARDLQAEITKIVQVLPRRFPNAKLVYLSSRTYAGWARPAPGKTGVGNSEPYSYETGFAVKWLIEQQLKGDAELNYDPKQGAVNAPWLSWGPYLWANGEIKRKDGFSFLLSDFTEKDQMHHSPQGQEKVGRQLLQFFKTDTTTRGWFLK
jgi:hypothetical protein